MHETRQDQYQCDSWSDVFRILEDPFMPTDQYIAYTDMGFGLLPRLPPPNKIPYEIATYGTTSNDTSSPSIVDFAIVLVPPVGKSSLRSRIVNDMRLDTIRKLNARGRVVRNCSAEWITWYVDCPFAQTS